jgi:hypothetical protein
MRYSRTLWLLLILIVMTALAVWRNSARRRSAARSAIADLSSTSPLNQPGGGTAPPESYEIYSALYQMIPVQEPLAFAEDSITDIPQVDGSCLKPSTPQEREMSEAFEAANQKSHRWEKKFTIPDGYRMLTRREATQAQACIENHAQDTSQCESYKQLKHVRFLGVPGFDHSHARALVSVVKMCGDFCGSGGIFEVEKTGGRWQRSDSTDFTRNCSWMY